MKRRDFVVTTTTAPFALAALPLLLDGDSTKAMTRLHSFSAA